MMISVIIPNYNGLEHLSTCLESVYRQSVHNYNIILVDNNSSDQSLSYVRNNFPDTIIIKLDKNYGFAKAVNVGIKYSLEKFKVNFIVLLNNDLECDFNFIMELQSGFKDKSIGSVACKMMNYYERNNIDDAGNFVDIKGLPYPRGQGEKDSGQYDNEEFIFGACAGAVMYRKEIFEKIGLFDEDFISYFEDIDFSFRLQIYGYKCLYNPLAVCYHKRSATGRSNIPLCRYLIEKNIFSVIVKNYPLKSLIKYFPRQLFLSYYRSLKDLKTYSLKVSLYALAGNFRGMSEIFKSLKKRKKIMKYKRVSPEYLLEVCKPILNDHGNS